MMNPQTKAEGVLTPEEIAEYIHSEFTPYVSMTPEEGKKHIAELIHRYAEHYRDITLSRFIKIISDENGVRFA